MEEWGEFVKKNTGLGWIEIDRYEYMDSRNYWNSCMDMKEHCAYKIFNILVLEFEYDLKSTLDNIIYVI